MYAIRSYYALGDLRGEQSLIPGQFADYGPGAGVLGEALGKDMTGAGQRVFGRRYFLLRVDERRRQCFQGITSTDRAQQQLDERLQAALTGD